jgi:hypothetical protein
VTSPSAVVIDSESNKATEAGGVRGYHAGEKVLGRKRVVERCFAWLRAQPPAYQGYAMRPSLTPSPSLRRLRHASA